MLGCDVALPFVFGAECAAAAVVGEAADELSSAGDFGFASLFDLCRYRSRCLGTSGSRGPVREEFRRLLLHAVCRGWFVVLRVFPRGSILDQVVVDSWRFSRDRGNPMDQSHVFLFDILLHTIQGKRLLVQLELHHRLMILLDLHLRKSHRCQRSRRRIPATLIRWNQDIIVRVRR